MTLKELYQSIDGDYDQAIRVMRMEKLIDKHIRKLPANSALQQLIAAGETMDPVQLFESSHAVKGVCGNLGLSKLGEIATVITEDYRPGSTRQLSDDEIKAKLAELEACYKKMLEGIAAYTQS